MANILLIHGSCHGAWCWRDLIPLLSAGGHDARAIDLPAAGRDKTPPAKVTLELYRDAIVSALDTFDGPVILLGHSAGGYPVSAAALAAPDKIAHLVFLCAYTPAPGKGMNKRRFDAPYQPMADAVAMDADGVSYAVNPAKLREKFYGDCSDELIAFAADHLSPQPQKPQTAPIENIEPLRAMPKSFIRCARDGAVPPEFQITMCEEWPEMTRYDLDSDHSPFLSQPARLAEILNEIANK